MHLRYVLPFLFLASPAFAVDFSQPILNEEGRPVCQDEIKNNETCPADRIATLGRIVKIALMTSYPDEQNLSGEEKYKRAEIAQSITGSGDVKLKLEDRVLIKKLVGKLYGPMVVFAAWNMLEK